MNDVEAIDKILATERIITKFTNIEKNKVKVDYYNSLITELRRFRHELEIKEVAE